MGKNMVHPLGHALVFVISHRQWFMAQQAFDSPHHSPFFVQLFNTDAFAIVVELLHILPIFICIDEGAKMDVMGF
ncbi:hypothetical protein [Iodidimonas gelatinilytica]|uniref:hypothetical protein n=1 Tax=Iodidimonas gelatinilytica TaxID=1236966 RepID=UPI001B2FEFC3